MTLKEKYVVRLSPEQRRELEQLAWTGRPAAATLIRARVLLKADASGPCWDDARIAEALECGERTVARVRQKVVTRGLEAALHRQQPTGRQYRKLDGAQEARSVALACSAPPEGKARWTLQLLADKLVEREVVEAVSDETVRRTLKKTTSSRG